MHAIHIALHAVVPTIVQGVSTHFGSLEWFPNEVHLPPIPSLRPKVPSTLSVASSIHEKASPTRPSWLRRETLLAIQDDTPIAAKANLSHGDGRSEFQVVDPNSDGFAPEIAKSSLPYLRSGVAERFYTNGDASGRQTSLVTSTEESKRSRKEEPIRLDESRDSGIAHLLRERGAVHNISLVEETLGQQFVNFNYMISERRSYVLGGAFAVKLAAQAGAKLSLDFAKCKMDGEVDTGSLVLTVCSIFRDFQMDLTKNIKPKARLSCSNNRCKAEVGFQHPNGLGGNLDFVFEPMKGIDWAVGEIPMRTFHLPLQATNCYDDDLESEFDCDGVDEGRVSWDDSTGESGQCEIRESFCERDTYGSCNWSPCAESRNAVCDTVGPLYKCLCTYGFCAVDGKCVPGTPEYPEACYPELKIKRGPGYLERSLDPDGESTWESARLVNYTHAPTRRRVIQMTVEATTPRPTNFTEDAFSREASRPRLVNFDYIISEDRSYVMDQHFAVKLLAQAGAKLSLDVENCRIGGEIDTGSVILTACSSVYDFQLDLTENLKPIGANMLAKNGIKAQLSCSSNSCKAEFGFHSRNGLGGYLDFIFEPMKGACCSQWKLSLNLTLNAGIDWAVGVIPLRTFQVPQVANMCDEHALGLEFDCDGVDEGRVAWDDHAVKCAIRESFCERDTYGSCNWSPCAESRNAVCDTAGPWDKCLCTYGFCALGGKCVPGSPEYPEVCYPELKIKSGPGYLERSLDPDGEGTWENARLMNYTHAPTRRRSIQLTVEAPTSQPTSFAEDADSQEASGPRLVSFDYNISEDRSYVMDRHFAVKLLAQAGAKLSLDVENCRIGGEIDTGSVILTACSSVYDFQLDLTEHLKPIGANMLAKNGIKAQLSCSSNSCRAEFGFHSRNGLGGYLDFIFEPMKGACCSQWKLSLNLTLTARIDWAVGVIPLRTFQVPQVASNCDEHAREFEFGCDGVDKDRVSWDDSAGKCAIRESFCERDTYGSCNWSPCAESRNAVCDTVGPTSKCLCTYGFCAVDGRCVPRTPEYPEACYPELKIKTGPGYLEKSIGPDRASVRLVNDTNAPPRRRSSQMTVEAPTPQPTSFNKEADSFKTLMPQSTAKPIKELPPALEHEASPSQIVSTRIDFKTFHGNVSSKTDSTSAANGGEETPRDGSSAMTDTVEAELSVDPHLESLDDTPHYVANQPALAKAVETGKNEARELETDSASPPEISSRSYVALAEVVEAIMCLMSVSITPIIVLLLVTYACRSNSRSHQCEGDDNDLAHGN